MCSVLWDVYLSYPDAPDFLPVQDGKSYPSYTGTRAEANALVSRLCLVKSTPGPYQRVCARVSPITDRRS